MRALLLAVALVLMASPSQSFGQRVDGSVGLGGQIGSPSGFTLNMYHSRGMSYDFLAAWDLDHFFFINGHGILELPLGDTPGVKLQYGPGLFVGFKNEDNGNDGAVLGISASIGLAFVPRSGPFEVYVRLTPRLNVMPDTDGAIGGGLGLRYYF